MDIFSDSFSLLFEWPLKTNAQALNAIELVLEAVKLSSSFLFVNPDEAWFQLHGRLMGAAQTVSSDKRYTKLLERLVERIPGWRKGSTARLNIIETYVKRMEDGGPEPNVRSLHSFLEAADGAARRLFALNRKVLCMTVMKDGSRIVCGCDDGTMVIANLIRGEVEREWHAHGWGVRSVTIGINGTRIVSGPHDGSDEKPITPGILVSSTGKGAPSGSPDVRVAKVWDFESRLVSQFEGHAAAVSWVTVLGDGNRIVSGSYDGTAQVWSMDTGRRVSQPFRDHAGPITCLAVFQDGDHIVAGGKDRTLRLWNASNVTQIGPALVGHGAMVSGISVTVDRKRIVSASWDGSVRIWCADTHSQIGKSMISALPINCISVTADGKRTLSGSSNRTVLVWNAESRRLACDPLVGHGAMITEVSFLPDGNSITSSSEDGTVRIWNLCRSNDEMFLARHEAAVSRVSFIPDGNHDMGSARVIEGGIRTVKFGGSNVEEFVDRHNAAVTRVPFMPDRKRAVTHSSDWTVRLWDAISGRQESEPLRIPERDPYDSDYDDSPDEQVSDDVINRSTFTSRAPLYVSVRLTDIFIWNLETRKIVRVLRGIPWGLFNTVAMIPNRCQVVTGCCFGSVRVWDLTATGTNGRILKNQENSIESVFVTDDGLRVVSVDKRDKLSLWDLQTRQCLKQLVKSEASRMSRRWVMLAIGEVTSEDDAVLIPLHGREIMHWDGKDRKVLATMESPVTAWALSPDKNIICLGLKYGRVAFSRLRVNLSERYSDIPLVDPQPEQPDPQDVVGPDELTSGHGFDLQQNGEAPSYTIELNPL